MQFEAIESKGLSTHEEIDIRANQIYDTFLECCSAYPHVKFQISGRKPYCEVYIIGNKSVGSNYDLTMWKDVPIFKMRPTRFSSSHPTTPNEYFLDYSICFSGYSGSEDWRKNSNDIKKQINDALKNAVYDFIISKENQING
jgi:hypothetical protein